MAAAGEETSSKKAKKASKDSSKTAAVSVKKKEKTPSPTTKKQTKTKTVTAVTPPSPSLLHSPKKEMTETVVVSELPATKVAGVLGVVHVTAPFHPAAKPAGVHVGAGTKQPERSGAPPTVAKHIPSTKPKIKMPKDPASILIPVLNIGTVGQIDHGKTTLTKALTGVWADRHSEELKRAMTIRLGYADVTMRKCPKCASPKCFTTDKVHPDCGEPTEAIRTVSFVDAPGHEALMSTMLSGAAIMDGAILVIAANEPCPRPQTKEHVIALEISGIKNVIVVQNKIDLVTDEEARANHKQITSFMGAHGFKNPVIIPVSAQRGVNIHYVLEAINEVFLTPKRDTKSPARFLVTRSFDVNKPGLEDVENLNGGVLGGALTQGSLSVNQEIEIRPGYKKIEANKEVWVPIRTVVSSLFMKASTRVDTIFPGGTAGIGTLLDPSITKSDALTGSVAGSVGALPPIIYNVKFESHLLERVVGAKAGEDAVTPIVRDEVLMININASVTTGRIVVAKKGIVEIVLHKPICAASGERVAISRKINQRWRLIGYGIIIE